MGWTLNGPISEGHTAFSDNFTQADSTLQQTVEKFWKLEDPVHLKDEPLSVTDREVLELWKKKTTKEDGHYVLPILFKQQLPQLPNNYQVGKHRLDLLEKRLAKDPELKQRYTESIHILLQKGYAEEVSGTNGIDGVVWYLPHHPVLNPRKPGKVHIVYSCGARFQGISLNDRKHQEPDLTNKLLGVLLKFRQEPVALNADIEGMFHQARVPPE